MLTDELSWSSKRQRDEGDPSLETGLQVGEGGGVVVRVWVWVGWGRGGGEVHGVGVCGGWVGGWGGVWPMVEMRLKGLLITRGVCICV